MRDQLSRRRSLRCYRTTAFDGRTVSSTDVAVTALLPYYRFRRPYGFIHRRSGHLAQGSLLLLLLLLLLLSNERRMSGCQGVLLLLLLLLLLLSR